MLRRFGSIKMAGIKKVVGRKNTVMKPVPKKFVNWVMTIQNDLQVKENKKRGKKKKISFLYAALEIERKYNK